MKNTIKLFKKHYKNVLTTKNNTFSVGTIKKVFMQKIKWREVHKN